MIVLILLDARTCHHAGHMLQEERDQLWTDGPLHGDIIMDGGLAAILRVEAIKLSKVAKTSTSIMIKVTMFVDMIKDLVGSFRATSLQYNVFSMNVRINDIVEDTISSGFH